MIVDFFFKIKKNWELLIFRNENRKLKKCWLNVESLYNVNLKLIFFKHYEKDFINFDYSLITLL